MRIQILILDFKGLIFSLLLLVETLDISELGRLLQLVLGCAVNCEDKQGMWADNIIQKLSLHSKSVLHLILFCTCTVNDRLSAATQISATSVPKMI